MDISGSCLIPAPRAAVWAALGDPEILKTCVPGCETIVESAEGGFEGAAAAKIGPIRAALYGRATPDETDGGRRLTFSLEADDAKAGSGRGTGEITLTDEEGGTLVAYQGSFEVTGKIAQLGPRLVGGFARQTVDQALARLGELAAEGRLPDAAPAVDADAPGPAPIEAQPAKTPEGRERDPKETAASERRLEEAPPLVHEEAAEAPPPFADAPPTAGGLTPPQEPRPIAPTATPAVPDPVEIAAAEAADPKSSGAVTRILLIAAIVIVVGFVAYVGFLQPPN